METVGLLNLAGFVALLIWGLHLVQSGVMEAYGVLIRRHLQRVVGNHLAAVVAGMGATTLLQSSTATGLIAAGFTATGTLDLVSGLAIMLGANVGTTLIVQLLSFDIAAITPLVILAGVGFNRMGRTDRQREIGKAVIGLGLMLFALSHMTAMLAEAARTVEFKTLLRMVSADLVLSLIFGALLAWSMHSSIAVVLLTMSFAGEGLIPLSATFALVLGANLGSAVNPILNMLAQKNPAALRLPLGNLLNRLIGCLVVLAVMSWVVQAPGLSVLNTHAPANFHMLFNLIMALAFLPILTPLARGLVRWLPDHGAPNAVTALYLDQGLTSAPTLAITAAGREVMRMADVTEQMLLDTAKAFHSGSVSDLAEIRRTDDTLDELNRQLKVYLTSIPANSLTESDHQRLEQAIYASMTFEHIGDIVTNSLVRRVGRRLKRQQSISIETWQNVEPIFEKVTRNIQLSAAVFLMAEKRAVRQLYREKRALDGLATRASRIHLERLREGAIEGMETSALEIDTLHDLRQINDLLTSIATMTLRPKGKKQKGAKGARGRLDAELLMYPLKAEGNR